MRQVGTNVKPKDYRLDTEPRPAEPNLLSASEDGLEKQCRLSCVNGDVRVIADHRRGYLRVSVEEAGRPVRGARVSVERVDGEPVPDLSRPLVTDGRGEVSLGRLARLASITGEVDVLLTVVLPEHRPTGRGRPESTLRGTRGRRRG